MLESRRGVSQENIDVGISVGAGRNITRPLRKCGSVLEIKVIDTQDLFLKQASCSQSYWYNNMYHYVIIVLGMSLIALLFRNLSSDQINSEIR